MKQPTKIKQEHVKCASCGKPIHISELAIIGKIGFYHGNLFCMIDALKDVDHESKDDNNVGEVKDLSLQCNCSDNECCSNCPEKLNNKMIKTLKDIEFERAYDYYNPRGGSRKICLSKDLRKEAIKHILEISSDNWDTIYYSNPLFIRFFNITEKEIDDAKNKNEVKG